MVMKVDQCQQGWSAIMPLTGRLPCRSRAHKRILVAEDEPLLRQLYTEVLVEAGHQVDAAENGAVAWDALKFKKYDLLITDYLMPELTGVDLLMNIHTARLTVPVVMVTATYPEEVFIRYPELQPKLTLLKPHTVTELLLAVDEVFGEDIGAIALERGPESVCRSGLLHAVSR